jgi:hypothetical protein
VQLVEAESVRLVRVELARLQPQDFQRHSLAELNVIIL